MKHVIIIFGLLTLTSCKKGEEWRLGNNKLYFVMQNQGVVYSEQDWNSIRVFYLKNGRDTVDHITDRNLADYGKPLIDPPSRTGNGHLDSQGVKLSGYIPFFAQQGINTFYFQHPNGDIDTMYIVTEEVSNKIGRKDPCYCNNPITKILFNGKVPSAHPTLKTDRGNIVYVFEK